MITSLNLTELGIYCSSNANWCKEITSVGTSLPMHLVHNTVITAPVYTIHSCKTYYNVLVNEGCFEMYFFIFFIIKFFHLET